MSQWNLMEIPGWKTDFRKMWRKKEIAAEIYRIKWHGYQRKANNFDYPKYGNLAGENMQYV